MLMPNAAARDRMPARDRESKKLALAVRQRHDVPRHRSADPYDFQNAAAFWIVQTSSDRKLTRSCKLGQTDPDAIIMSNLRRDASGSSRSSFG
jgi:hypothetical protein